jgi:hypothetical protein
MDASFTAGPNPVARSRGRVFFFRQGVRIEDAVLTVYDPLGNVIKKIHTKDRAFGGSQARRSIGSWDLTNVRGRHVSTGAYALKGSVVTAEGKREKVSVIIGVR